MKLLWNKALSLFFLLIFLSACSSGIIDHGETLATTYPSQFVMGDVYVLKENEIIDGNISGIGTTLVVEEGADVFGSINLVGSQMEISGSVVGDINSFTGSMIIKDTANINGSINQIASEVTIDPGAKISGEINSFILPEQLDLGQIKIPDNAINLLQPKSWIVFQIIRSILLTFITVLIIFLFKESTLLVAQQIKHRIAVSWGTGLLVSIAVPIVSLVFFATICLSPIGIIIVLAYFIANLWGWATISLIIGNQLSRWIKVEWSEEANGVVGAIALGILFTLLALIPPISFLISFIISAAGLGGVILSKVGSVEKQK